MPSAAAQVVGAGVMMCDQGDKEIRFACGLAVVGCARLGVAMPEMPDTKPGRLEAWVLRNSSWLALGIIAAAFALRLVYSGSCYLNPDEALHFWAARPSSWLETYKASFFLAHHRSSSWSFMGFSFLGGPS